MWQKVKSATMPNWTVMLKVRPHCWPNKETWRWHLKSSTQFTGTEFEERPLLVCPQCWMLTVSRLLTLLLNGQTWSAISQPNWMDTSCLCYFSTETSGHQSIYMERCRARQDLVGRWFTQETLETHTHTCIHTQPHTHRRAHKYTHLNTQSKQACIQSDCLLSNKLSDFSIVFFLPQ